MRHISDRQTNLSSPVWCLHHRELQVSPWQIWMLWKSPTGLSCLLTQPNKLKSFQMCFYTESLKPTYHSCYSVHPSSVNCPGLRRILEQIPGDIRWQAGIYSTKVTGPRQGTHLVATRLTGNQSGCLIFSLAVTQCNMYEQGKLFIYPIKLQSVTLIKSKITFLFPELVKESLFALGHAWVVLTLVAFPLP